MDHWLKVRRNSRYSSHLRIRTFKDVMRPLLLHAANTLVGTVPTIFRTVPGISIYCYTLSFIRHSFVANPRQLGLSSEYVTVVNIGAGAFARAFAGFLLMPVTVIKVRFESTLHNYKSLLEASTDIVRKEGMRGFSSGFGAIALRDAPHARLQVGLYEAQIHIRRQALNSWMSLKTSFAAKFSFIWASAFKFIWCHCRSVDHNFNSTIWCNKNPYSTGSYRILKIYCIVVKRFRQYSLCII